MTKKNVMILKAEGVAVLFAALYFYDSTGYSWWLFGLFLLVDISMIGYVFDKRIGSLTYNLGHSYVLPLILLVLAVDNENTLLSGVSIMWISHIGFDRAQGYGLKEETGFHHTHLGKLKLPTKKTSK